MHYTERESKKFLLVKYTVLILEILFVVFILYNKPAINEDDIWTLLVANSWSRYHSVGVVDIDTWSSAGAIEQLMWVVPEHRFDFSFVGEYFIADVHPPLYNIVLHFVCSIFMSRGFSLWYGYAINIIIFTINWLMLFLIGQHIYKKKSIALIISAVYGITCGVYSEICFIRFYMLASCFVIASLHLVIMLLEQDKKKYYVLLTISAFLGMLTFYPFGIYLAVLSFVFVILQILSQKWKKAVKYISALLVAAFFFFLSFPQSIWQVLYGTPGSGFRDPTRKYWTDSVTFMKIISKEVFGGYLVWVILLLLLLLLLIRIFNKKKAFHYGLISLVAVPVIIYILLMNQMSPFNTTGRYHSIIYPIIILGVYGSILYLLYELLYLNIRKTVYLLMVCVGLCPMVSYYIKMKPFNTIEYLMYPSKVYVDIAKEYKDVDCVCVIDSYPLKAYINYTELKQYNRVLFTTQDSIEGGVVDDLVVNSDEMVVYITQGLDQDSIINCLQAKNPILNAANEIYQYRYMDVIHLGND